MSTNFAIILFVISFLLYKASSLLEKRTCDFFISYFVLLISLFGSFTSAIILAIDS